MKNKLISVLLLLTLTLGILAPASRSEAASLPVNNLKLRVGTIYTLRPQHLLGVPYWTTSDKTVATVNQSGVVVAKGPGTTLIRVKAGNTTLACKVSVVKKKWKKGSKFNPRKLPKDKTEGYSFDFYMEEKKVGRFNIQIEKFASGEESAKMALNNSSNPKPGYGQQYLFFSIRLKYLSGTQTVKMANVFNHHKNIFGSYGTKYLKPVTYGFGFGSHENISTVNISPGNTIVADAAILVESGFIPVVFRLQTGPKSYTWIKI